MAVNFLGVGSGLDLSSMLNQLVQVAQQPKVELLGKKEVEVNSRISGLGALNSALSDFQDAVQGLKSASLFTDKASSVTQPADGDVVSVEASSDAVIGDYDVIVSQLSSGSRAQSSASYADTTSDFLGAGDMTFSAGGQTFAVNVSSTDSLEDIVTNINSNSDNSFLSATIVGGNIVYKSSVTGAGNDLEVTNTDSSLDALSTVANAGGVGGMAIAAGDVAKNAKISVDGIDIESSTNVFDGDVTGLTITASSVSTSKAKLSVTDNRGAISSALSSMVSEYNKVVDVIKEQNGSNNDDGDFVAGPMNGSSILRQVESVLTSSISGVIPVDSSSVNSLYSVGVTIEEDGYLSYDSSEFYDSYDADNGGVKELFTNSDIGFAVSLDKKLENYLEYDGVFDSYESGLNDELDRINDSFDRHIEYITSYKERLQREFASLDSLMATMNATMSYVSNQLAQLPGAK